jgi:hypothetical protein
MCSAWIVGSVGAVLRRALEETSSKKQRFDSEVLSESKYDMTKPIIVAVTTNLVRNPPNPKNNQIALWFICGVGQFLSDS